MGKIPTVDEYLAQVKAVNAQSAEVYRYMNFDQIPDFVEAAASVS